MISKQMTSCDLWRLQNATLPTQSTAGMGGTDRKLLLDFLHQVLVLAEMSGKPKRRCGPGLAIIIIITYIIIIYNLYSLSSLYSLAIPTADTHLVLATLAVLVPADLRLPCMMVPSWLGLYTWLINSSNVDGCLNFSITLSSALAHSF